MQLSQIIPKDRGKKGALLILMITGRGVPEIDDQLGSPTSLLRTVVVADFHWLRYQGGIITR